MTKSISQPPTFEPDVDHEISEAIQLSELIRSPRMQQLPKLLQRAVHTAFAAHFRALMEFFHDRTPEPADWSRLPHETRYNVPYSKITGASRNPYSRRWNLPDLRRFRDAHKLVGHLAAERHARRGMRKEWGQQSDWLLLKRKIRHFLRTVSGNQLYKRSKAAARKTQLK